MKQPKPRPYPIPGQSLPTAEPIGHPGLTPEQAEEALSLLREIHTWTRHKDTPWAVRTDKLLKRLRR